MLTRRIMKVLHMKCFDTIPVTACLLLLAACGGSSGGSDSSNTPVAETPASDTETPSADIETPAADGQFPTVLAGAVPGGNTTTPETTSLTGNVADIRFDDAYNLRIIVGTGTGNREVARFDGDDIVSKTDGLDLYQNDRAILISSTPEGVTLGQRLDYTTYGRWREFDPDGAAAFRDGAAFFAGVPTNALSTMPAFGFVSYQGGATAQVLQKDGSSTTALVGESSAVADFAAGVIDLTIDLRRPRTGESWGSIDAFGLTIDGDRFGGNDASSSRGHQGLAAGRFFGPEAAEIGGVAELEDASSVLQAGFGAAR